MENSREKPQFQAFSGNVGINVLANLVAAAIIYITGVLVGLFPRSPGVVAIAAAIVAGQIGWIVLLVFLMPAGRKRSLMSWVIIVVFGVSLLVGGFVRGKFADAFLPLPYWVNIGLGGVFALAGVLGIARDISLHRLESKLRDRIKGLHWIEH